MHRSIPISPAFWNEVWILAVAALLLLVSGCQNRAPSLRMLDTRAGYGAEVDDEEVKLYQRARSNSESTLRRGGPRVAQVYVHPHPLPTRDYFWGGYVSLIVSQDDVVFEDPEAGESEEEKAAIRQTHRGKKRRKQ